MKLFIVKVGKKITAWDCTLQEARRFATEDFGTVEPQDDLEIDRLEASLSRGKDYRVLGYSRLEPSSYYTFLRTFGLDK